MKDKIIEFMFLLIVTGIIILPFYIFLSFVQYENNCASHAKIKSFIAMDRYYVLYELEDGSRWQDRYHHNYQNGEEVCINEQGRFFIKWKPFTFRKD